MNKKQRNRKLVTQNKRNRTINRRYTSTIKTLSKLFYSKVSEMKTLKNDEKAAILTQHLGPLSSSLYCIIDKAVKKGVLHKNTAARKKSRVGKIIAMK